jgi:hypothetical protein
MGIIAVKSAANHNRLLFGQEWLKTKRPAEEVLIIGATLGAANEITRNLVREKRASFGYHRLTWGQLASALARPLLNAQRTVPLGGLGVQAVANRAIHKLSQVGGLGRYADLTSAPGFGRAISSVVAELRLEQIDPDALAYLAPDERVGKPEVINRPDFSRLGGAGAVIACNHVSWADSPVGGLRRVPEKAALYVEARAFQSVAIAMGLGARRFHSN